MASPHRSIWLGDGLLLLAAMIWGSAFVVVKQTLDSIGPFYTLALRFSLSAIGAVFLFGRSLRGLSCKQIRGCLWVGCLLFVAFAFQTVGLAYTTPGKNAFLTTAYVLLVPFVCWKLHKQRLVLFQWIAAALALVGIALISVDGWSIGMGEGLSLLCGLFFALHIVAIDRVPAEVPAQAVILLQFTAVAGISWLLAPWVEPSPFPASAAAWGGLCYLGLGSALVGFSLQTFGQRLAPPSHAAILLSLEAVFGCVCSFLWLGERFSPEMLAGCCILLAAVLLSEWSQTQRRQKARHPIHPDAHEVGKRV